LLGVRVADHLIEYSTGLIVLAHMCSDRRHS
jgi:hypothetical protein